MPDAGPPCVLSVVIYDFDTATVHVNYQPVNGVYTGAKYVCSGSSLLPSQYGARCRNALKTWGANVEPDGTVTYKSPSCRLTPPSNCTPCADGKTQW